jgi:hypothetical protein
MVVPIDPEIVWIEERPIGLTATRAADFDILDLHQLVTMDEHLPLITHPCIRYPDARKSGTD